MASENHRIVIGELLNRVDQLSKKVLSAYNPSASYNSNLQNLKKFDAAHLERTAFSLGFTVRDEDDKKLYKNLSILTDRIILKIESLFETDCSDCGEKYRNKSSDEPLLTCQLCLQGSHCCPKIRERVDALKNVPDDSQLIGMVWICYECMKKNNLALLPSTSQAAVPIPDEPESTEQHPDEQLEETADLDRGSPRRNRDNVANEQTDTRTIDTCEAYKKRNCPHGLTGKRLINGKPCDKKHPPRCFRYCKHGENRRLGCLKGSNCKYFHPRLCKDSVLKRECLKQDCSYDHLKFTRRSQDGTSRQSESKEMAKKPDRRMRFNSVTSVGTPTRFPVQKRSVGLPKPPVTAPTSESNSFLLQFLENMKEGIINQVSEKMTQLQATIPSIVQEQIRTSAPPLQQYPLSHSQQPLTYSQAAQNLSVPLLAKQHQGFYR